jgi:Sporulation and spore germination
MIPRYQRILFWTLVAGISFMALFLIRGCHQAHQRLAALNNATPIAAPADSTPEEVTLYLASDADATITPSTVQLAVPKAPTLRARVILNDLIARYAEPGSGHPLQSGPAVDDIFIMPAKATASADNTDSQTSGDTAIINLHDSFVENHPSGIEVENLTLLSIIGTLHDALPQVTQVRFLVDGQSHDTLAGHADLTRSYPAVDTTTKPTLPQENAQP